MAKAATKPAASETDESASLVCPNCGGILAPVPRMPIDVKWSESPAADARLKASAQAKDAEFGRLYKCANCRYLTRIKVDGA